jgi:hypothetical protein
MDEMNTMHKLTQKMCSILIVSLILLFLTVTNSRAVESNDTGYPIMRQIQYSFTVQNKSNKLLEKAEFWTYAPVKQTSTQRTLNIEASYPYQLIEDELGNQILYFQFSNVPPYDTKIITIRADLALSDTANPGSGKNLSIYLRAEKTVESDNAELSQFAKRFAAERPIKTSENIFRWVADNVKYAGYLRDERGALYAFKKREGDCTEFMSLFVALCRANEIPARRIGGYVITSNAILKPNEYHNWAEFHENGSWKIADPQKKVFVNNQSHYIAMRVISDATDNPMGKNNRFRSLGEGLVVKMNSPEQQYVNIKSTKSERALKSCRQ